MSKRIVNFEDIGNSIEIFGIEFELDFNGEDIKRLKEIDVDNIDKNKDEYDELKDRLCIILNDKEAYTKINKVYNEKKGKDIGCQAILDLYDIIFKEYSKNNEELEKKVDKYNNIKKTYQNREKRRYNNRNSRRRYY